MSFSLSKSKYNKHMKELVIAAYDRDYSWVKLLNPDIKVTVYRKGPNELLEDEILVEPNLGRDVHTFFNHLYTQYDTLADVTFFSQDFPFDHVSNYVELINGTEALWNIHAKQSTDGCWFFCTQYGVITCDRNGAPHHPGLDLPTMWATLFDTDCPDTISFTPTGHFAITKDHARKIPKEFYKHTLNILETQETSPWEIERLEPYIFLR